LLDSISVSVLVGLRKTSLIDYPGILAAVLFFPGCNLRCPWCHNPELVLIDAQNSSFLPLEKALSCIENRKGRIKGVVLTGGEPTLSPILLEVIKQLKALKLLVKLDTNGMRPDILAKILEHDDTIPDYIALDLKWAPERYTQLSVSSKESGQCASLLSESVALLYGQPILHEYRTVVLPEGLFTQEDVQALAPLVDTSPWYFSPFRSGNCLDPQWNDFPEPTAEMVYSFVDFAHSLGKHSHARNTSRRVQVDVNNYPTSHIAHNDTINNSDNSVSC
jgi:pyruvate formate lyase activating enzyme